MHQGKIQESSDGEAGYLSSTCCVSGLLYECKSMLLLRFPGAAVFHLRWLCDEVLQDAGVVSVSGCLWPRNVVQSTCDIDFCE